MSADQRFFDFLKRRIGLDVASVGPAIIERGGASALHRAEHAGSR
jgi:chemotaxis protein methyltransferase WspC